MAKYVVGASPFKKVVKEGGWVVVGALENGRGEVDCEGGGLKVLEGWIFYFFH